MANVNAKAKVSPGVAVFAVLGLVAALASIVGRPTGDFDGGTTRIGVPKASNTAPAPGRSTASHGAPSEVPVVRMQRVPARDLADTVRQSGVFGMIPAEHGEGTALDAGKPVAPTAGPPQYPARASVPATAIAAKAEPDPPAIGLTGIIEIDEKPMALLTGPTGASDYLGVGDTVAGCTVKAIGPSWVDLGYGGRIFRVMMADGYNPTPLQGGTK